MNIPIQPSIKQPCHSPIFISGAAAISAFGFTWRGLGKALVERTLSLSPSLALAAIDSNTISSEVPAIPPSMQAGTAKVQKLMSRAALLGAIATQCVLMDADWKEDREHIGFYLGVGASGGSITELTAMLHASIQEQHFSLEHFGSAGLAACNPLFAFQLMNNFTLCHGAILNGIGGPNSAFYSRGNGTVAALFEAMHAIREHDCERALVGGVDSAVHAVTWAELLRDAYVKDGFIPGEGAALLALSKHDDYALAVMEYCQFQNILPPFKPYCDLLEQLLQSIDESTTIDWIILAPWGEPARQSLLKLIEKYFTHAAVLDISRFLGDALAAAPALGWVAALDLIQNNIAKRCLVLNAGIDGGIGAVLLGKYSPGRRSNECPQQ